ncbi:MAG: thymidine kinase [Tissierellia bacterium]|nr:thymidine kinase [Tissierellia bacterium]
MAKLYFRYGAMNSGKSTALIQVAHNYEERGMKVLVLKPEVDSKIQDSISSRIGIDRKVDYLITSEDDVFELVNSLEEKPACILVDEAQFLEVRQIDQLFRLVIDLNLPVISYGLRTDFSMTGFPASERLLLLAHDIEELKTICRCGRKAILNGRKIDGKFTFEGDQVVIDNQQDVSYEALCGQCYLDERRKHE